MKKSLLIILSVVASSVMLWLISAGTATAFNVPISLNHQHPMLLAQTENGPTEMPTDEPCKKNDMEEEQQGIEDQEKGLQEEENGMEEVEKGMEEDHKNN